jgi:hypothetical protein
VTGDVILEFEALLALDRNEVEPTVFEDGLFDPREIIHAVFRRDRSRIFSLGDEIMREDDGRKLLVDLNRGSSALRASAFA